MAAVARPPTDLTTGDRDGAVVSSPVLAPALGADRAYAGLVTRAIAIVIDVALIELAALVVSGAWALLLSLFQISQPSRGWVIVGASVLFFVWVVGYFAFFWTSTGQTPGSRVMQIRVTRSDGTRVGPGRALVRLVWMVLSLPLLWGYLPILFTSYRRTFFDLMAGTVVTVLPSVPPPGRRRRAQASGIEPPSTVP